MLNEIWSMQQGATGLSQCILRSNISILQWRIFYHALQEHIDNNNPTISQVINFIKAVLAKNKDDVVQVDCMEMIITIIINKLRYKMGDEDVYNLLVVLAENNYMLMILNLIYFGKYIRSISIEKINRLIECSVQNKALNYHLFWAVWAMVGAGRRLAPDDLQKINGCINGIQSKIAGDGVAGIVAEIKTMIKLNMGSCARAREWLMSFKEENNIGIIRKKIALSGVMGLVASATKEEFAELFYELMDAKCSLNVLREIYFLAPNPLRSNKICMVIMRQLIRGSPISEAVVFMHSIPQHEHLGVQDLIELCKLAKDVRGCDANQLCITLMMANIKKIKQCLEKNELNCKQLYEYFRNTELYWGIALFGNYFKHFRGYGLIIKQQCDSIVDVSSNLLEVCCYKIPRKHEKSPLLQLLSQNITRLLVKAVANFVFGRHQIFENFEYGTDHALVCIFASPFFKNYVSADDVTAFCSKQLASTNSRSIQNICIFFNAVEDEKQEFIMKKRIYAKLFTYVPRSNVMKSLNRIGFNFIEVMDNEWMYVLENSRKQKYFSPDTFDSTICATIKKADKYQLLALLREKIV